jgi:demethylsterigmatocystin 6-O-methyltransferase
MHKIMHDWPDHECVEILTHLRDAMAADSRIFINDCIVPEKDSPLQYVEISIIWLMQRLTEVA